MLGATHPVRTVGSWRPCFVRSAHLRWRLCPHGRPSTELPTWTVAFVPYEQAAGRAWCQAPPECRERQAFGSGRGIFAAVITASLPWLWQQQAVRRKCDGWYVLGAAWRSTALHEQASPASRQACLWMSLPRANPQRGKRALLAVHLQVCRFAGLQVCGFALFALFALLHSLKHGKFSIGSFGWVDIQAAFRPAIKSRKGRTPVDALACRSFGAIY